MVFVGINGILGIFVNGLSASFGDIIARDEKENLKKTYKEFEYSYYIIIAIVYAVSFVLIMPFVNIYTANITDANYNQPLIGFLFVLNGLLSNIKTPQGTLVISAGLYKETRYQNLAQALILGCVLAPSLGIAGILIASCISNFYRDIDLSIFIPKKVTKLPAKQTYKNWLMLTLIIIITIAPYMFFNVQATNYMQWIINAIIAVVYASIVSVVIGLIFDKKEFKAIFSRIKYMVVKK